METLIREIAEYFKAGEKFVEILSSNPFAFRKQLHKAVRRRGLTWTFAITENSVFVIK